MSAPSPRHRGAFDALFGEVTRTLGDFGKTLDRDESRWFMDLLAHSEAGYRSWDRNPELADYLARVSRLPSRALANLAYSYLHLAYDLPRLLADSFERESHVPRERLCRVYSATGRPVAELARVSSVRVAVFGGLAIVLRIAPGGPSMGRTIGNWLLVHRCTAWAAAEKLVESRDRAGAEKRLARGVEDAARRLFPRPDPLFWLRRLPLASTLVGQRDTTEAEPRALDALKPASIP